MKYSANWHRNKKFGNAIKSGKVLRVGIKGAVVCTGKISKKVWYGWKLVQINQGINDLKFTLKKYSRGKIVGYPPGHYQLHLWAWNLKGQGALWRDNFYVD